MLRRSPRIRRAQRGDILFGPLFFIGFMAAVAIPAYQDYTIRAQVSEGLNLAAIAKASVAEYYAANGKWPANLAEAGIERIPNGRYVRSIIVNKGTIVVRYGAQAHPSVAGHRLTLRPVVDDQQNVIWTCGYREWIDGADPASGAAALHKTNIAQRYLPRACRSEAAR